MKVLIISTTERTGGGAIAACRLLTALNRNDIQARMLVRDRQTDSVCVATVGNVLPKVAERLRLMAALHLPLSRTWAYDLGSDGVDILSTREYAEADVIHLHWVNQGMLSLRQLQRILASGKRVVWTMHDEWPFRGILHYTDTENGELPHRTATLEQRQWLRKQEVYSHGKIHFVGCSRWIADMASQAMPGAMVHHVNNCIPQDIFRPQDMTEARRHFGLPTEARLVLFSCQKVTDRRKGMQYMAEAVKSLRHPDLHLVVVGGKTENLATVLTGTDMERVHLIPYVHGELEMARLYAAADCFVSPSLQDNLPNTIAEAMSCGTPCVGFRTGGIPEMITHMENGYVAHCRDSEDLAGGIMCALEHPRWREAAHHAAAHDYNESRVAREYARIYEVH